MKLFIGCAVFTAAISIFFFSGCASDPDSKAITAIDENDLPGLEENLQENAKKMNLTWSLSRAVDRNNLQAVKILVKYGADVKVEGLLFNAVQKKDVSFEVLDYLLEAGADINTDPVLMAALGEKRLKVVQYLAEKGADLNKGANGYTPLSLAVYSSADDIFQYLLEKGVNNTSLSSALNVAVDQSKFDLVRTLVEKGANVTKNTTILKKVYDANQQELYAYLRDQGAPHTNQLLDTMMRKNTVGAFYELTNREINFYGRIYSIDISADKQFIIDLRSDDRGYDQIYHAWFAWSNPYADEVIGLRTNQNIFVWATFEGNTIPIKNDDGDTIAIIIVFANARLVGN